MLQCLLQECPKPIFLLFVQVKLVLMKRDEMVEQIFFSATGTTSSTWMLPNLVTSTTFNGRLSESDLQVGRSMHNY